jgi:hypothetical protein
MSEYEHFNPCTLLIVLPCKALVNETFGVKSMKCLLDIKGSIAEPMKFNSFSVGNRSKMDFKTDKSNEENGGYLTDMLV